MDDSISIAVDLKYVAILFNAVLLLAIGLAMLFVDRIDSFGKRFIQNGGAGAFFPPPRLDPTR